MSEKSPLVLLPGLLCSESLWRHQIAGLADIADCTVADLTGHETMAAMAAHVLDGAPPAFALAGLSMGGYLAQEIMRLAPQRVTRLAILDSSARSDSTAQAERRRGLIELARSGRFRDVTSRLLPLFIHPDRLGDVALTDTIMGMAESVGREAFLRQQSAIMSRPDGRDDLSRIACPTLVLCGRQDELTPLELHEEMAAAIPDARLVVIEDCGHLPTLERPDEVNAAMRAWLLETKTG